VPIFEPPLRLRWKILIELRAQTSIPALPKVELEKQIEKLTSQKESDRERRDDIK